MCPANHPGDSSFNTFLYGIIPGSLQSLQVACDGSDINPVSLAMLNLKNADGSYYVPGSGAAGFARRQFSSPAKYTEDQYIINADYVITPKHTLAARYFYTHNPQTVPFGT